MRPIYKKGNKLDCETFREISIPNAAYRMLSQIIFRRLLPVVTIQLFSGDFVFSKSVSDSSGDFLTIQHLQFILELLNKSPGILPGVS